MRNLLRKTLHLPEELRRELKKPLGELFPDLEELVSGLKRGGGIVTVGDRVTFDIIGRGIHPDLAIVDLREMRKPVAPKVKRLLTSGRRKIIVKNPPGTLTPGLFSAISGAGRGSTIIVEGEEDLAALPAILLSPPGTRVIYGQPGEGVVLVRVTSGKKEEIWKIVKRFKPERKGDRGGCPDEA